MRTRSVFTLVLALTCIGGFSHGEDEWRLGYQCGAVLFTGTIEEIIDLYPPGAKWNPPASLEIEEKDVDAAERCARDAVLVLRNVRPVDPVAAPLPREVAVLVSGLPGWRARLASDGTCESVGQFFTRRWHVGREVYVQACPEACYTPAQQVAWRDIKMICDACSVDDCEHVKEERRQAAGAEHREKRDTKADGRAGERKDDAVGSFRRPCSDAEKKLLCMDWLYAYQTEVMLKTTGERLCVPPVQKWSFWK